MGRILGKVGLSPPGKNRPPPTYVPSIAWHHQRDRGDGYEINAILHNGEIHKKGIASNLCESLQLSSIPNTSLL